MADAFQLLIGEIGNLKDIREASTAIVQYALSLGEGHIEHSTARFVMRPDNFITFEPHWKRVQNFTITLRGNPNEFEEQDGLKLKPSMAGYCSFSFDHIGQLAASLSYIRRSKQIFERGRTRVQTTPKTIER